MIYLKVCIYLEPTLFGQFDAHHVKSTQNADPYNPKVRHVFQNASYILTT